MSVNQPKNTVYGLSQAILAATPAPIVSKRNPAANDYAAVGTIWCNITNNNVYILASIVANVATWIQVQAEGGGGVFASLVVDPGPTILNGNTTMTGGTISATGTINLNAAGAGVTAIGTGTGAVNIGNATGALTISAVTNINTTTALATNIGAGGTGVVNIGNATGNTNIPAGDLIVAAGNVTLQAPLAGYVLSTGVVILSGAGDPNGVAGYGAPQGSLFLRTNGTGTGDRAFINTDGGTTWTAITTAA
jgi:hypothetical protein